MKTPAPITRVTFTQTTVDREIDRLWLRVSLRAAELGLTLAEVARRVGMKRQSLRDMCSRAKVSRANFARLTKALEGYVPGQLPHLWWERELPNVPPITVEKMREAVRRKMR